MRTLIITALIATASAGAAFAETPGRITDSEFLKANRCLGLATASTLSGDADGFRGVIKAQSVGRNEVIVSMGKKTQARAVREARGANEERLTALKGELGGACQALLG